MTGIRDVLTYLQSIMLTSAPLLIPYYESSRSGWLCLAVSCKSRT